MPLMFYLCKLSLFSKEQLQNVPIILINKKIMLCFYNNQFLLAEKLVAIFQNLYSAWQDSHGPEKLSSLKSLKISPFPPKKSNSTWQNRKGRPNRSTTTEILTK